LAVVNIVIDGLRSEPFHDTSTPWSQCEVNYPKYLSMLSRALSRGITVTVIGRIVFG
jgi:hypothetical protein